MSHDDCNSGEICNVGDCTVVCSSDTTCAGGELCTAGLCVPGRRDAPTILSIDGDSDQTGAACPGASAETHCISRELVVSGSNLLGAQWSLTGVDGVRTPLEATAASSTNLARLTLPLDLQAGDYSLSAANQAGTADQVVTVLQGLQGPAGSADTPQDILAKLLSVDGPGSGLDADQLDGVDLTALIGQIDALQAQLDNLSAVPAGSIVAWGGAAAPGGWVLCDGAAYDTLDPTYADLFAAIACTYGCAGPSFNVPDLQQRFPIGAWGTAGAQAPGATGGSFNHSHEIGNHTHTLGSHTHTADHAHTVNAHSHTMSHTHGTPDHQHVWAQFNTAEQWNTWDSPASSITLIDHPQGGYGPAGSSGSYFYTLAFTGPLDNTSTDNFYTDDSGGGTTGAASATNTGDASPGTDTVSLDTSAATGNTGGAVTGNTGTSDPPYLVVQYIIKL